MDQDIERKLDDLTEQVATLADEVRSMQNGRYVTRADLAEYLTISAFRSEMDRLSTDVVAKVSRTLQAMVHDALDSAWKEDFRSLYIEMENAQRAQRRKEMKEDIQQVFGTVKLIVLYIVPFVTVVNIFGQWMNWW